jgi:hypothetical protein
VSSTLALVDRPYFQSCPIGKIAVGNGGQPRLKQFREAAGRKGGLNETRCGKLYRV